MNESQLRDRLAAHAAATTIDRVAAWDRISAGRRRPSVARRLMPVGALALGVVVVVLAVNIAGDGSRVRATSPAAANLPNRPPAIEGSVYGLMSGADECKSDREIQAGKTATYCLSRAAGRLDLPEKSLVQITAADDTTLLGVQFAREALWGWRASSRRAGVAIGPMVGSQVEPITGLKGGVGQGSGFAVSDDGRIAWTSYRNVPSGGQRQELYVYDSKTGRTTTLFSSANTILGGLTFGPSGDIAVVEGRNWSRPAVLVVAKDGSTRRLEFTKGIPESDGIELAPILGAPTVTWSSTGLLAVTSAQVGGSYGHTYIIDAAAGKLVRTIRKAHAQAWSPDGTGILVVRSKVGRDVRLSVAYGPGLAREKDLGPLHEAVTLRTWVAPEKLGVADEQSWPLWPEHTPEAARAAEAQGQQPWRTDPGETALRFSREVLSWAKPHLSSGREATPTGGYRFSVVDDGGNEAIVELELWSGTYFSVSASSNGPEWLSVSMKGRDASIQIRGLGAEAVEAVVRHGERVATKKLTPRTDPLAKANGSELQVFQMTLPYDPDTPGTLLLLWKDTSGGVFRFAATNLPRGDVSSAR